MHYGRAANAFSGGIKYRHCKVTLVWQINILEVKYLIEIIALMAFQQPFFKYLSNATLLLSYVQS